MKRIYIIVIIVLAIVIGLNAYFFDQIKTSQQDFQRNILLRQTQLCGNHVERTVSNYESDLNRIIFKYIGDMHNIFKDKQVIYQVNRDLESFYAKYRELITNISVYDNNNRYLGIYINDYDDFVIDTFSRQKNNELEPREIIREKNGYYLSYFPFFDDNKLVGNVVVEINFKKYLAYIFSLYRVEDIQWQWLINTKGNIVFSNNSDSVKISGLDVLADSLKTEREGLIYQSLYKDGEDCEIISAYYPLSIIKHDLGIVFTMNSRELLSIFVGHNLILGIGSFLIIVGLVVFLLIIIRDSRKKEGSLKQQLIEIKMITEKFPVGIMILNKKDIILNINRTAQKMLFLDREEDLIGKQFEDQFLISNNYLLKDVICSPFDSNHFIHYHKDGNEVVIYRRDVVTHIAGEKLTISALIDVSPMEKARKQEAAANQAKSDFLARMSHEIRTPMNGIIGMTDSLVRADLTEDQKEYVMVIRKSSELLMNIINDILDFSKIEAGKMMLEEIPFSLSEEINIAIRLFKPLAVKKDLEIQSSIKAGIPDHLIGDPFRLRQVISNLLSNAIKFTDEGRILISVEMMEKYNSALSLLFYVEDTGIGLKKEDINKIFGTFQQGQESTSRKYGGTGLGTAISKQLVEMMNGEIWVESPSAIADDPKYPGTRFCFTIEVHSDEKIRKKYDFSSLRHYQQITALVVTKKKDKTDKIHHVLDSFGINYNLRTYDDNTIDSVLYHIDQKRDLYQMIIIKDKPRQDGFGFATQLKESGLVYDFPVIMISSNDQHGNYLRSRNLEIDYYVIQPYDNNEIFNVIKDIFPDIEEEKNITPHINKIRTNLNILVADDNIINQRVIQTIFKHLGYEIDIAQDGKAVIESMKRKNYDLILMDLLMPVMDGIAATIDIRKSGNKVIIIAMTGSDDREKKVEAYSAGMNDFVIKPVKAETIKHFLIKWFSETI